MTPGEELAAREVVASDVHASVSLPPPMTGTTYVDPMEFARSQAARGAIQPAATITAADGTVWEYTGQASRAAGSVYFWQGEWHTLIGENYFEADGQGYLIDEVGRASPGTLYRSGADGSNPVVEEMTNNFREFDLLSEGVTQELSRRAMYTLSDVGIGVDVRDPDPGAFVVYAGAPAGAGGAGSGLSTVAVVAVAVGAGYLFSRRKK